MKLRAINKLLFVQKEKMAPRQRYNLINCLELSKVKRKSFKKSFKCNIMPAFNFIYFTAKRDVQQSSLLSRNICEQHTSELNLYEVKPEKFPHYFLLFIFCGMPLTCVKCFKGKLILIERKIHLWILSIKRCW